MANYNIGSGFSDTHDNQRFFGDKFTGSDSGPYVGVVKNTLDPLKMGRLGVLIPALSNVPAHHTDSTNVIWCQYLSPFYGVKPFKSVTKDDPYNHQTSQSSYGMWAVPPDIDTHVLVIFAQGDKSQTHAFWIGCIQEPMTNQMIPGLGAKEYSKLGEDTLGKLVEMDDLFGDEYEQKISEFGTDILPIGEKNKSKYDDGETIQSSNEWMYPVNVDLATQLHEQGLIQDEIRGVTTSSARRESPSQVFGISTPGPIKSDSRTPNIGLDGTPVAVDRDLGHSFVMDDGDEEGDNHLIRLRTASGHQLLMHDTEGVVYLANASGKAFIEMDEEGRISIYSDRGIAIRSSGDFNLHSDKNIHFHARENIKFTSEKDLMLNSEQYIYSMGQSGILNASQGGAVKTYSSKGISSHTDSEQLHSSSKEFHLQGSQVHFNKPMGRPGSGGGTSSADWGPSWLKPEHEKVNIITREGLIDVDPWGPFDEDKIEYIDSKTTVRDTGLERGSFEGDYDPRYKQPTINSQTGDDYASINANVTNRLIFDNAWQELEALIGPEGRGNLALADASGTATYSDPNLDSRRNALMAEFGIVTPYMDKKFGVGNMEQKKKEFFKGLRERQKYTKPDQVKGVFVTHEPFNRDEGVYSEKPMDPNYDPYYRTVLQGLGDFDNEWLELEHLIAMTTGTFQQFRRRNQLIKKYDIDVIKKRNPETGKWETTGDKWAGNIAEKKAKFYEDLKKRQKKYQNLTPYERDLIISR
jgi:hypothetical protein